MAGAFFKDMIEKEGRQTRAGCRQDERPPVRLGAMQHFTHKMQGAIQGNGCQAAACPDNPGQGDDDQSVVGSKDGPFISGGSGPSAESAFQFHPFITLGFHI